MGPFPPFPFPDPQTRACGGTGLCLGPRILRWTVCGSANRHPWHWQVNRAGMVLAVDRFCVEPSLSSIQRESGAYTPLRPGQHPGHPQAGWRGQLEGFPQPQRRHPPIQEQPLERRDLRLELAEVLGFQDPVGRRGGLKPGETGSGGAVGSSTPEQSPMMPGL